MHDFELLGALGYGGSSEVFLVRRRAGTSLHAMKVITKQLLGPRAVQQVVAENQILQRCVHPYIVPLHYSFQDVKAFYLLFQYMGGGDLFHHLQSRGPLDLHAVRLLAAEVELALDYLHSEHAVIYRDLKPENILLSLDGHAVLADFGSARALHSTSRLGRTIVGTPAYMAPEVFLGEGYGIAVDWWALGVLVHEAFTGELPGGSRAARITDMESELDELWAGGTGAAPSEPNGHSALSVGVGAKEDPAAVLPASGDILTEDGSSMPDDSAATAQLHDFVDRLCCRQSSARLGCGKEGASEIQRHKFFHPIDWQSLGRCSASPSREGRKRGGGRGKWTSGGVTPLRACITVVVECRAQARASGPVRQEATSTSLIG